MKIISLLVLASWIITGCGVGSVYPITKDEQQKVYKKEMKGSWEEQDGKTEFIIDTVKSTAGKNYSLVIIDRSDAKKIDSGYFRFIIVELNKTFYIDCSADMEHPAVRQMGKNTWSTMIPMHVILKVIRINNGQLIATMIDKENLMQLLQKKKINLRYENIDHETILLLEKETVLQQKLIELEKFPAVYADTISCKRTLKLACKYCETGILSFGNKKACLETSADFNLQRITLIKQGSC